MGDLEFLKKLDGAAEAAEQEDTTWMDVDTVMKQLTQAAYDVLYEKHPDLKPVIEQLKQRYKEVYVYFFTDDEFYIIRPLKRVEYKELINKTQDPDEISDLIFKAAVLWPKIDNLDDLKAGVVPTIVNVILQISNFNNNMPVVKL